MLTHPDNRFREIFDEGFGHYLKGDWSTAQQFFDTALHLRPYDEPTKSLLAFTRNYFFQAPPEWQGFRVLIEK